MTALTLFDAYELSKEMIAPLLASNAELLHALERAASKARSLIERSVATQCSEAHRPARI